MACVGLGAASLNAALARSGRSLYSQAPLYRSRSHLKVRGTSSAHRTMVAAAQATETATLACGCFWSPDAKFAKLPGVVSTSVGYTGGSNPNPTYDSVCSGDGHTEAVKVDFNPQELPYEGLLKEFFQQHDATSKRGSVQYKSAIWYHSPEQQKTAEAVIKQMSDKSGKSIATDLAPASQWTDAEDYHQKYYSKSGL